MPSFRRVRDWKDRVKKKRDGDPGVVTSPASLGAPHIDSRKSSTSNLPEPHVPPGLPSNTVSVSVASTSDEPSRLAVASLPETISSVSFALTTSTHSGAEECRLVTNHEDRQTPKHSTSQRLWNAAYDRLEKDEDTAELVKSYMNILTKALSAENTSNTSTSEDNLIELRDPADRQEYMRKLVEEGRERFVTTSKITGGLQNVTEYIQKIKGVVDLAIGNIPQAALPWAGVSIGLQILSNPGRATKSNLQGIVYVTSRMDWYCALSECLLDEDELVNSFESVLKQLNEAITILYKALLLYQIKSACYYHQHRGLTVLRGLVSWDDWDGDLQTVKEAERDVEKLSNEYQKEHEKNRLRQLYNSGIRMEESLGDIHQDLQALVDQQKNMWTDSKNGKCLKDLFVVDPRNNMRTIMQNKEDLLADVYKWIFHSDEYAAFTDWGDKASPFPECRLLWITGSAGTGKTMLLMGIIEELQRQFSSLTPRLSYFFCQATKTNLDNATNALRSLIWLLLFQQPRLIKHIQPDHDQVGRALFENEDAFNALDSIFENMLKDPCLSPVYFIIDALDECDKGLALLLRLISKSFTLSDRVKWLVSSRPEVLTQQDIQQEIHQLESPRVSRFLVELDRERLKGPVNVYIDYKLSALKGLRGYNDEVLANISTEVRQRANNIFLWVALVFKELSHVRGWDAVKTIQHMPRGLPGLYDRIMEKIEGLSGERHCKNVLVAVSLAFRPLSFPELAVIADLPAGDDVPQTVVEECGSLLVITAEAVSLIHQSAKDYLDENHEFKLRLGGVTRSHMDICNRSIDAMSALKENIYGKDLGFYPNGMKIPDPDPLALVRYACFFWVDHLSFSPPDVDRYYRIHSFLRSHFLHWLEALSLMGNSSQCFRMMDKLETISSSQSELYSLIHDAKRFMVQNAFVIEFAPIQLYSSAILFSPQASRIRNLFRQSVGGVNILSGLDSNWGRNLHAFNRNHRDAIFSTDGKSLILSSTQASGIPPRSSIQVRNAMTGQVERMLEGHSNRISTIALSRNGNMLASGSHDKTIRIWDMITGRTESILEGHAAAVLTVMFSPCGNFLVSGTQEDSERLWLWDVASGEIKHRFEVPEVEAVLFSSSGEKLVVGSNDGTTWIWDFPSCQNRRSYPGYLDYDELCLAMSPNGSKLASRADKKTIQIWDVATWEPEHLLKGHSDRVTIVLFSPGNKLLSGSWDCTIRVWNATTGHVEHILTIDKGVFGMALSLDGSRLASYSRSLNGAVQLWNTTTWENECKLPIVYGLPIASIAFSPDGQKLVSNSSGSVYVWDIAPGLAEYAFEGHCGRITVLVFSPDGSELISGSDDATIRIWNVTTGRTEMILPHSGGVTTAAFSPDGSTLASATNDAGKIYIWDIATGQIKHTLTGYNRESNRFEWVWVPYISFSPDGRKVAFTRQTIGIGSTSGTGSTYLLDLTTGQLMVLHRDSRVDVAAVTAVAAVVFSPDGESAASAAAYNSIRLWNTTTGQEKGLLKGHNSEVITLAFSPDGRKLASASYDGTTRIWEVATGRIESTFDCSLMSSLLFSPDGNKLASGNTDRIQVWNLATRRAEHVFRGHYASIATTIFDLDSDAAGQIIDRVGNRPFYSIDRKYAWVTRNGTKVLYLPTQFQPQRRVAVRGRTLATANNAGRVTIIQFAEGAKGSQ
ncbi:WD40-repeat-containing domain protein [Xylaria castorea]|nr:WD40-repeat-containing domain protein [Xylaria castorea]